MKKKITMLFLVVASATAFAQDIGMGIGNGVPDASAILDINSATKGVLIPRITITDLNVFQLQGDTKAESMLVYNQTVNPATNILKGFHYWDGAKWELITSESRLKELLTKLEEDLNKRIDNITEFESNGEKSFMVVFKPDSGDVHKGIFSYLEPIKDGAGKITGYTRIAITLEELVKGGETETFFREIKKDLPNADGDTDKDVVVSYIYFSEAAIKNWLLNNPGKTYADAVVGLKDDEGQAIDVESIITKSFVKNLDTYAEYIKKIIYKTQGSLKLNGDKGTYVFERTKADGTVEPIDFNKNMETLTSIGKSALIADGALPGFNIDTALPTTGVKGQIYYQYITETDNGDVKNYINLTSDILYSVTNNKELRDEITKITNTIGGGANVYYGKIGGIGDDLLFTIDDDGKETPIDISKNIIKEITTNTDVQNSILEVTRIDIVTDKSEKTNTFIDGKPVYKRKVAATVAPPSTGQSYNIEFNAPIILDNSASKVISIQILKKDGSVACDAVRDVTLTGMNLTFKFGVGAATTPLATGSYDVIVEFVGN